MKSVCITLKKALDRQARAKAHFVERGLNDVMFFPGVDAKESGLITSNTYDVDNPHEKFNIGHHCVGIWSSHRAVWSSLILMDDSHLLVFEDDVILHDGWIQKFNKAMNDVPKDFDFLFLGSCCANDKRKNHVAGDVWDVRYPFCLHAYVIAKKAVELAVSKCSRCFAPIDLQLATDAFPFLKVYTVLPRIADQFNTELVP